MVANSKPIQSSTKLGNFNWSSYFKDFKVVLLLKCFTIFILCYVFLSYVTAFLIAEGSTINDSPSKTSWPSAPFEFFPKNDLMNLALAILLISSLVKVAVLLKKGIAPVPKSLCIGLSFAAVYYFLIRCNPLYDLYSFSEWGVPEIKYYDIFIVVILMQAIDFRSYQKNLVTNSNLALTEDQPGSDYDDEIGNQGYSEHVARYIKSTATKASFAIGVLGEWGSGKTDFLKRLYKCLDEPQNTNILIEFNPWRANKADVIVEDFFTLLSAKLKPYSRKISNRIKHYSTKILQPGKEIQFRILDTLLNEVIKTETNQERYDSINSLIESTGKRIIIFIDDLDRLNGCEIFEVLRIIRNTANFSNTFFIVAMDEDYVKHALKKTNNISKEEHYLRKIFQYTLVLPKIRKEIFPAIFKEAIKFNDLPQADREKIDRVLTFIVYSPVSHLVMDMFPAKPESYFESLLDNIRDVKRFSNSFKIAFSLLKDEVDPLDLALLELIKAKSIKTYEAIADRSLIKSSEGSPTLYILNDDVWNSLSSKLSLSDHEKRALKSALQFLFNDNDKKSKRKFVEPKNFNLYFSYQLLNLVSVAEFVDILSESLEKIAEKFGAWDKAGKQSDLLLLLDSLDFDTKESLIKIVKALLVPEQPSFTYFEQAKVMLAKAVSNTKLFESTAVYREAVLDILNDVNLHQHKRAKIANNYLKDIIYRGVEDYGLTRKELVDMILALFKDYMSHFRDYHLGMSDFFLLNDLGRTDENHIIINHDAGTFFKDYILDGNFELYFKNFVRSYYQPNMDGMFTFDPFYKQIFDNLEELKDQIANLATEDKDLQFLKQIVLDNWDKSISGDSKFQLDKEKTRKLLKYLKSNGQYPHEIY